MGKYQLRYLSGTMGVFMIHASLKLKKSELLTRGMPRKTSSTRRVLIKEPQNTGKYKQSVMSYFLVNFVDVNHHLSFDQNQHR